MSFFDRNIDAIERAAQIVFWGSLMIIMAVCFSAPVNMFTFVALVVVCAAKLTLSEVAETWTRWDREAAERGVQWQERLRANREHELRREIRRLRRPER
ncbi:hypothetical protein [Streptosporangium carneum]|uniref:Uncharacterized protein n=1 Tax=Streptosporangium carneum TaxID=47481 RepID=A0A9W6MHW9_9ACTN|nr:hypothetical protein [Streptosporangium carneum]GLK15309.1 hypothetical protein GCM10017600_87220 [Streptosporangium carneum]